jgi:PIN domain nuclease of toxin-antitoxin system
VGDHEEVILRDTHVLIWLANEPTSFPQSIPVTRATGASEQPRWQKASLW